MKDKSPSLDDEYKQHNTVTCCQILERFALLLFLPFINVGGTEEVITTCMYMFTSSQCLSSNMYAIYIYITHIYTHAYRYVYS